MSAIKQSKGTVNSRFQGLTTIDAPVCKFTNLVGKL